jgi:hypothetical protein
MTGFLSQESFIRGRSSVLPSGTRGRSRMPELGSYGSVRGAAGNSRPYRDCRHDEAIHALRRPASEKRQGTKSREVGHRWCRGRYGDLAAVR